MAFFARDDNGVFDDRVRLALGGDSVLIAESYTVTVGVLQQPSRFSLKLGSGRVAAEIRKKYPPRTPFRLFLGDVPQQTGYTDGEPEINGSATGGTDLTITGRDTLAPLHDGHVEHEFSLRDETYKSLVEKMVTEAFLIDNVVKGNSPPKVVTSNAGARKIRSGVPLVELAPPRTIEEMLLGLPAGGKDLTVGGETPAHVVQQTKLGETYLTLIRRYLDRAGLMLWAGPDGNYVLSAPNANQKPAYAIERLAGSTTTSGAGGGAGNVVRWHYRNDTVSRYSIAVVYGRGGGKKKGRGKSKGGDGDDEMINWGFNKPLVIRDANVQNPEQAAFLCARKLAEGRRQGWALEYTLSGHTTRSLVGGGRAIWTPDTVVAVDDQEMGIKGEFYLEQVEYHRGPETTTTLRLMRKEDLVFGDVE